MSRNYEKSGIKLPKASGNPVCPRCKEAEYRLVVGWMVHGDSIATAALYPLAEKAQAFDAAKRWGRSITALAVHPKAPDNEGCDRNSDRRKPPKEPT